MYIILLFIVGGVIALGFGAQIIVSSSINLANIYKRLGEFTKAIDSYNKAIQIKPNHVRAHHNLGNTYNQLGESTKAIASFKKS